MKPEKTIPVMVTTEHRGVFFGYIEESDVNEDPLTIYEKQMCTYFSHAMRGVFGLSVQGPDDKCRIGPPAKKAILKNITSVVLCTKEAEANWKKQPWG